MSEIVINAQNLSKNFYNFDSRLPFIKRFLKRNQITIRAVQDISFTIKRGSIVGFIGSNGAGKSTTIKMLTGTLYPSSGKLEVNGEIPFKRSINFRKKISIVVGNKLQLFQDVSAMDYFQLIGTLYEVEPAILQERIQELSNLLNVKDQLYQQVRTLSLGQKMKMEFIAASLTSPEILFLDEPTIGLDIQSKKDIRTFLKKMNEECHTTIILTSHDMDDISSVCDELIVIDKGKIILQESMDVILSKFSDFKYLKIKMTLDLVPELCSVKRVVVISQTKSECILKIPRDFVFETLESINKLVDIEDFEISNLSLEEIILQNYFTKKEHN